MPSVRGEARKLVGAAASEFDRLHPRDKGGAHGGEFVDVIGRLKAAGAKFDEAQGVWLVPTGRRSELDALANDAGWTLTEIPEGMKAASNADRTRLRIPPGWTDVFVSDAPDAKRLAVGRDEKGRQQSIYSTAHSEAQAAEKFARIKLLEDALPKLDKKLDAQAGRDDTAAAMLMIRELGLRPGSDRDTRAAAQAFGASTLQRRHVQLTGDTVRLSFVGKKGVKIDLEQDNPRLAKMLRPRLAAKAGNDRLFDTTDDKLRAWLDDAAPGFKVKDLRTRLGTASAHSLIKELPEPTTPQELKRQRNFVGDHVASLLGNTRTMALGSYIDPSAFAPWENADTISHKEATARVSRLTSIQDRLAEVEKFGLNDWPEQGDLARRVLRGAKDTQELHTVELPDGRRAYTAKRAKLHDQIVGEALHEAVAAVIGHDHPSAQKLANGERLTPEEADAIRHAARRNGPPKALFMAGGPASGKSSALREDPTLEPPGSVTINPDDLKEGLPEYKRMIRGREKYAAAGAHEESSDLGKRLQAEAMELGLPIVVDGTGDSKPGKFRDKIAGMRNAGYQVDALYVTIPTDEAVVRQTLRALREGRWVPVPELRNQHANVSRNFAEVEALGIPMKLYDNGSGTPQLIFEIRNGKRVIRNRVLYDQFIAKQHERT